jgi:hypothetical protein
MSSFIVLVNCFLLLKAVIQFWSFKKWNCSKSLFFQDQFLANWYFAILEKNFTIQLQKFRVNLRNIFCLSWMNHFNARFTIEFHNHFMVCFVNNFRNYFVVNKFKEYFTIKNLNSNYWSHFTVIHFENHFTTHFINHFNKHEHY